MKNTVPEFMKNATNVYRTQYYIVRQVIGIRLDCKENNAVYSYDTYFKRTPERDMEYEVVFYCRRNKNGKRLPTTMYARTYVE